jgi:hypothetical protein
MGYNYDEAEKMLLAIMRGEDVEVPTKSLDSKEKKVKKPAGRKKKKNSDVVSYNLYDIAKDKGADIGAVAKEMGIKADLVVPIMQEGINKNKMDYSGIDMKDVKIDVVKVRGEVPSEHDAERKKNIDMAVAGAVDSIMDKVMEQELKVIPTSVVNNEEEVTLMDEKQNAVLVEGKELPVENKVISDEKVRELITKTENNAEKPVRRVDEIKSELQKAKDKITEDINPRGKGADMHLNNAKMMYGDENIGKNSFVTSEDFIKSVDMVISDAVQEIRELTIKYITDINKRVAMTTGVGILSNDIALLGGDMRSVKCTTSKLNVMQVREIKALLRNGASQGDIAARYGVSKNAISDIKVGRSWKYVE